MSAAEYYTAGPLPGPPQHASPRLNPPQPQRTASGPPHSSPPQQQHPPPPYQSVPDDHKQGVHFAPPPAELQQRHSFSGQQRPSFSGHQRPSISGAVPPQRGSFSNSSPRPFANTPPRGSFSSARPIPQSWESQAPQHPPPLSNSVPREGHHIPYGTPPQNPSMLAPPPHMRPYVNPNVSQYSLESGYSSEPEPRRHHHHKHRSSRRDSHDSKGSREVRDIKKRSRSTNTDGFLGAAGGGLIGDLIFPGLGTLGGAALGWIGGKDYGNHRKWREDKRQREQRNWEDKYRRSPSRSDDEQRQRRHTYERRHSHY